MFNQENFSTEKMIPLVTYDKLAKPTLQGSLLSSLVLNVGLERNFCAQH